MIYDCGEVDLKPADILVLYSDGITEAAGVDGEEFGFERLVELVKELRGKSLDEIRDTVLATVRDFAGTDLQDDMTLVIFKVEGQDEVGLPRLETRG